MRDPSSPTAAGEGRQRVGAGLHTEGLHPGERERETNVSILLKKEKPERSRTKDSTKQLSK